MSKEGFSLKLLGGFNLSASVPVKISERKAQALLAFLALNPDQQHDRGELAALLWPDRATTQARASLSKCLTGLRKNLGQAPEEILAIDRNGVTLHSDAVEIDVARLQFLSASTNVADLRVAAGLYKGELLAGFGAIEDVFAEWLRIEREAVRRIVVDVLSRLSEAMLHRQDAKAAVTASEELAALDPLNEQAHRLLMRAYQIAGRRSSAVMQYQACKNLLANELGIEPEAATKALLETITQDEDAIRQATLALPQADETQFASQTVDFAKIAAENERPDDTAADQISEPAAGKTPERRLGDRANVLDKPSIAVLAFDNMSRDPDQEYFSDGITEDIITNLSRIKWLFVTARNSSFVYRARATDVRQISNELGVRYILEGSVRKAGEKVRITAQLIDAETSAHLWAERYDRDLTNIFEVQDEITENVAGSIEPIILAAEGLRARLRSRQDIDAWDMVMQALPAYWRLTREDSARAITRLQAATEKHPQYGPAHSMLAFALLYSSHMGWTDLEAVRESAEQSARLAFDLDDQDAWAHIALGYVHAMSRNAKEAVLEFTKAIDLSPNFAAAYGWRGSAKVSAGQTEEGIADINLALRLSPKDPQNAIFTLGIGSAHYFAGRMDEAISCAEESIRLRPSFPEAHRMQCAALAKSGRIAESKAALKRLKKLQPDVSASLLRRTLPITPPEKLESYIASLSLAGLPE